MAQDQFVKIGDQLGAAQCSRSLGNIFGMQSNYEEAADIPKYSILSEIRPDELQTPLMLYTVFSQV